MKEKIKAWLWKSDEEGISNFDFICMFIWNCLAWAPMIIYLICTRD
jgi:hypothetical protein